VNDDADDARPAERETRLRRWLPYGPPLAAVAVAAFAITVGRARPVFGARVIAGTRADAQPFTARAIVVRHDGGGLGRVAQVEVRVRGDGAKGQASVTDEDGVSELRIEPPLPASFDVEGKIGGAWQPLAHVDLAKLPPRDPKLGMVDEPRSSGRASGALVVTAAPERSALAPQVQGAAWVRVQYRNPRLGLLPAEGARVTISGDAGVEEIQAAAITDVSGLARIRLTPGAPPVMITVKAEAEPGGARIEGTWEGTLGAVYATPYPAGDGSVSTSAGAVDVIAPSSIRRAYFDLWHDGVRVSGGAIVFDAAHKASVPLPRDASGVHDLELSSSPDAQSADDLSHAIAWPIVVAKDPVEGLSSVLGDPRFDRALPPATGSLGPWNAALPATIAFARASIPRREIVASGLDAAFAREEARGARVRRLATLAILAGALIEIAIVLRLGFFSRSAHVDEEIEALARDEGEPAVPAQGRTRRVASMALGALGIVTLIFAALAMMAAGLR
jgi:hypothetical protein